jgi:hypothetical protein
MIWEEGGDMILVSPSPEGRKEWELTRRVVAMARDATAAGMGDDTLHGVLRSVFTEVSPMIPLRRPSLMHQ